MPWVKKDGALVLEGDEDIVIRMEEMSHFDKRGEPVQGPLHFVIYAGAAQLAAAMLDLGSAKQVGERYAAQRKEFQ
jgi:hypothetical protein